MHELTLCRNILDIVQRHVVGKNCQRVNKITLEIGELMAIDQAALQFGFEAVSKGTIAEHASLDIIVVAGLAICDTCEKQVKLSHYYDACEHCGRFALRVMQGEALRIKCMEIE